jgi:hypothetical protein
VPESLCERRSELRDAPSASGAFVVENLSGGRKTYALWGDYARPLNPRGGAYGHRRPNRVGMLTSAAIPMIT